MQLYVGRRISSAYSFCCIFPSFRVSRSLSRPFKALFALRSRLLPYKAAALCSQSLTRNTDGPNEARIVDYRLPGRGGQDGPSRCPLLKPFYRRRNPACLSLSCATHPSFPPFSFPSLSSASQPVMWLPSIHAVLWQHPVGLLSQSIAEFMFYAPNEWKLTAHHNWLGFDISSRSLYVFLIPKIPFAHPPSCSFPVGCQQTLSSHVERKRYCFQPHSLSVHLLSAALSFLPSAYRAFTCLLFRPSHRPALFVVSRCLSAAAVSAFVQKCHKRDIWHRLPALSWCRPYYPGVDF